MGRSKLRMKSLDPTRSETFSQADTAVPRRSRRSSAWLTIQAERWKKSRLAKNRNGLPAQSTTSRASNRYSTDYSRHQHHSRTQRIERSRLGRNQKFRKGADFDGSARQGRTTPHTRPLVALPSTPAPLQSRRAPQNASPSIIQENNKFLQSRKRTTKFAQRIPGKSLHSLFGVTLTIAVDSRRFTTNRIWRQSTFSAIRYALSTPRRPTRSSSITTSTETPRENRQNSRDNSFELVKSTLASTETATGSDDDDHIPSESCDTETVG